MSSRPAVGSRHPPQQHPTAQVGPPGGTRHVTFPQLSSNSGSKSTGHAESPSVNTIDVDSRLYGKDGYTSTAQASPTIRSEADADPTSEYSRPAPLPSRPGLSGQNRRVLPVPSTIPQIPVKPAQGAPTAAESRRQNVEIPAIGRVYPQGSKYFEVGWQDFMRSIY
jgi:hypothetical protein